MSRKTRKQRVVLRSRRRSAIKVNARRVIIQGLLGALAVGFAFGVATKSDSFFSHLLDQHIPTVDLDAPVGLQGIAIDGLLPKERLWLWTPWALGPLQKRIIAANPSVGAVTLERGFRSNHIRVRLEPRSPLVRNGAQGMDANGVSFPLAAGSWSQLPSVQLSPGIPAPVIGKWLGKLSMQKELWMRIKTISTTAGGDVVLQVEPGTAVLWGAPDSAAIASKTASLLRVLDDAHQHLGGAASADLRFFEDGRIIVRPKGVPS